MTREQREDLYIEWEITSTETKQNLRREYREKYGDDQPVEHWEEYLVEALNVKPMWKNQGLI